MSDALPYNDDEDHLVNGVLRLLDLSREEFERWRELSGEESGGTIERLAAGWQRLRPAPPPPSGADDRVDAGPAGRDGRLWHGAIAESPEFGFARGDDGRLAWLVRWTGTAWTWVSEPPVYEEGYFEGGREQGGYGGYRAEAGWRLEKAARQVRELQAATGIERGRVLDIGSGYGYFRVALGEGGYEHEGVEVSDHAREVAAAEFGHETQAGVLEDHIAGWRERFDAVTAFDLIEHVPDPGAFMTEVFSILRPGGCVGLKTPNVDAPEADVFGPHYHSLKREHLILFSPDSLTEVAGDAGFEPVEVSTVSHLLRGFVGEETCREWAAAGRGADIVAWYRRPA